MKIGILTFHCAHNYGAVLQAYATQEQLKSMGHEVEIIDYRPKYLLHPYGYIPNFRKSHACWIKSCILWLKLLIVYLLYLPKKPMRRRGFNRFINEKLNLSSKCYYSTFSANEDYDLYIMGSDQIWSIRTTQILDNVFFGNFKIKENAKMISYAASMPLYTLTIEQRQQLEPLLHNFTAISVRERQLSDFLLNTFNIHSQVVLDPTLLVDNSVWREIATLPIIRYKYVLVYTVGMTKYAMRIATQIAEQIGAVVVELSSGPKTFNSYYSYSTASPEEFVGWFQNASFVVTSSFHGTAFALSYQKPFYSIMAGTERDSRQQSILVDFGLEDRFISKNSNPSYSTIDYTKVLPKWKVLQAKSLRFITNNLSVQ